MGEHAAKSLDVTSIVGLRSFDQGRELLGRGEQMWILEEEPRHQWNGVRIPSARQRGRIEIEQNHTRGSVRLVPIAVGVTRWHEHKLAREIAERRARQSIDIGFSIPTSTTFE